MRVLMINSVCGIRSTGRICTDLADILEKKGHEVKIAYGRDTVPEKYKKYVLKIGNKVSVYAHALKARIFDEAGFGSKSATRKFIKKIKEYDPDIIHLHNLHGYYLHLGEFFKFLKEYNKPILWSFYDCWAFTGHCAHFDFNACGQWKQGCTKCKFKQEYPTSLLSKSAKNYQRKKALFLNVPNLQIIVPSLWMQRMVRNSYMQKYPVHVFPNGIDINSFVPTKSDFRAKNDLEEKFVVLGVASFWTQMKGLDVFNRLAEDLDEGEFQIVLVGKADKETLSPKILHISATNNIQELCALYTMANVFINPTLQETQGLTTVEAFACGTPAIVYHSGGVAECVDDTCGLVVERGDYNNLLEAILCMQQGRVSFNRNNCICVAQKYEVKRLYQQFIKLYEDIICLR